jgi:hypothetical protein
MILAVKYEIFFTSENKELEKDITEILLKVALNTITLNLRMKV